MLLHEQFALKQNYSKNTKKEKKMQKDLSFSHNAHLFLLQ